MLINSAFRDNSNHSFSHHYHLAAIFAASMEENSVSDHKLCGFLCVVLVTKRSQVNPLDLSNTLRFGTRCRIFGEGSEIGFLSDTGVVLSPLNLPDSARDSKNCENVAKVEGVQLTRKRKRRVGLVRGSISVVTQLHALVMHKCLAILARVVRVDVSNEKAEAKVEVLVDAYFPIALWSGWQFPRSGTTAAALCRHLSCDWTKRNLILGSANGDNCMSDYEDEKSISDFSPCHVLGCKLHCSIPDSSKKKLFELDEVFKSLPRVTSGEIPDYSRVKPANAFSGSGICDISDDILINIFASLGPRDLVKVSATCHHLRLLAASIMPCMKLKLFPHQQAAVEWMLLRERNPEALPHPLYMNFVTEDGFCFYVNAVSGEIVTGLAPTIRDFRGGMFCDEPGLGKTITALSLILKTQGTLADPPDGAQVIWCTHNAEQRCGYYEINTNNFMNGSTPSAKRFLGQNPRRGQLSLERINLTEDLNYLSPEQSRLMALKEQITGSNDIGLSDRHTLPEKNVVRCPRRLSQVKRNLLHAYEGRKPGENSCKRLHAPNDTRQDGLVFASNGLPYSCKKNGNASVDVCIDTWVQCDACHKWRRLPDASKADDNTVWFCSMNTDLSYQRCNDPEESWDDRQSITYFPGFYARGTAGRKEQNISFFTSVLKEHYTLMNSETRKSLTWLASLSPEKLSQMETIGLVQPIADTRAVSNGGALTYHKIFHAFGLVRKVEKGISRWFYPPVLSNMIFDLAAFRVALCKPLDWCRLYLSTATLIVVPSNLIDHWKTQIQKHVRPGQLQVYVWSDHKKPSAHNLAWDYDVVITTFNRLSAEWGPRKRSVLMQVHWLRVMLDEGHTLGSSLNLTNKLQMAVSLMASRRWILTGTPTPNTPNSQLSHLQPILKFLHEEAYGLDQKSWEAGILRLFEAEMEDGRSRLLQLLHRCMISARKVDLQTIPHCIKKATLLDFTEEHAKSYNELVATVRRNILMADWNDPSHVESLLNPKQWKFRSTTIRNVRLSCCVAGHIKVTDAGQDIQETMDILVGNGLNPASEEYVYIKHNLLYGGNCLRCKEWCRLPIITPCRHLLCLDCIALDSEKCPFPGCGCLYEMQSPEILARPENPSPKWPVPKDLIELQPSYKQDDWDPDWQSTSSSKVRYLVQRLKTLQEANGKLGCSMGDDKGSMHADKLQFSHKNCNLHVCLPFYSSPCNEPYKMLPDKVIIFSQFLEHIHVIGQQLTIAGIKFAGMYSPMHSSNKMKSLAIFQNDASCMALLMDGSAALGLDLSFVTHVFLMEPIWDRSVEEQVVSRAHRMGATRPVHVETLAMHGTIEEQMLEFLQDANGCRKKYLNEKFGKSGSEGARPHRTLHDFAESGYLARLSSVCTSAKV